MKVITIGRSHDNVVRIDDPYVGRHHCQIVQHDNGMFTIVDHCCPVKTGQKFFEIIEN